jgi:hypothetical protein
VILRMVALVIGDEAARSGDMSECMIVTLPWPDWESSLGLVACEAGMRRWRTARHSTSLLADANNDEA